MISLTTVTPVDCANSLELLRVIEEYQASLEPIQWTNFSGQVYCGSYLTNRIRLLYEIGSLANILALDETFTSNTIVTQKNQDVCDSVCDWVENRLGFQIYRVNVYGLFIWNYQRYSLYRVHAIINIGIRSGLLSEDLDSNSPTTSALSARLVLNWVYEKYGIELPFLEKYQLDPEPLLVPKRNLELPSKQGTPVVINQVQENELHPDLWPGHESNSELNQVQGNELHPDLWPGHESNLKLPTSLDVRAEINQVQEVHGVELEVLQEDELSPVPGNSSEIIEPTCSSIKMFAFGAVCVMTGCLVFALFFKNQQHPSSKLLLSPPPVLKQQGHIKSSPLQQE